MAKAIKTNVLRHLDALKIPYETREYTVEDEQFDGLLTAHKLGMDPAMVFKTLVLTGDKLPACGQGAGPEGRGPRYRQQAGEHAPAKGAPGTDRIPPGRVQPHRDEEGISHVCGCVCPEPGKDFC